MPAKPDATGNPPDATGNPGDRGTTLTPGDQERAVIVDGPSDGHQSQRKW